MTIEELQGYTKTALNTSAGKIIIVWGPTGIGKTSTFCQAPKSVLVECSDESSDALKEVGFIPENLPVITANDFYHALEVFDALAEAKTYRNVIIDGGSGLKKWVDQITLANECEHEKGKFAGFGYGERSAAFYWMDLVEKLKAMKTAGIWVFFICHGGVSNIKNPQGHDFPKSVPDLGKDRLAQTVKEADAVLFMDFVIAESQLDKISGKAKMVGGDKRVMYTTGGAAYEAKNRLNLPSLIDLGNSPQEAFNNFANAVRAGKKA